MIISDLNHFEEVVAEAPHVVGGENVKTTLAKLDPELVTQLKAAGFGTVLVSNSTLVLRVLKTQVGLPL